MSASSKSAIAAIAALVLGLLAVFVFPVGAFALGVATGGTAAALVVTLALGLAGGVPAIAVALAALAKIKREGLGGRGMAVTGLVLGICGALVGAGVGFVGILFGAYSSHPS